MEKDFIINKEDLRKYLNCKRVIKKVELQKYYIEKNVNNFNAVFNATPR